MQAKAQRKLKLFYTFSLLLVIYYFVHLLLSNKRQKARRPFFFQYADPKTIAEGHEKPEWLQKSLEQLRKIFVSDYVQWHNETMSNLKASNHSKFRALVFIGNGATHGLGDRIRGILYAYIQAVFSERVLLIDWREPYPLSSIFNSGTGTNFTFDEAHIRGIGNSSLNSSEVKKAKYMTDLSMFLQPVSVIYMKCEPRPDWYSVFNITDMYPELHISRRLKDLLPLKVRPKTEEMFPLLFNALFRSSEDLDKLLSTSQKRHFPFSLPLSKNSVKNIDTMHPYVSVHARLGHGVGEFIKRFDLESRGLSLESVARCMANETYFFAKKHLEANSLRIYLATDTAEFRKLFSTALHRIDPSTVIMFGDWDVKHVKHLRKNDQMDFMKYMYTIADLYFLSEGTLILCSRSGFCNIAKWMGRIRTQKLFKVQECVTSA